MLRTWLILSVYIFLTLCEAVAFNPYTDPLLHQMYSQPPPPPKAPEYEPEGYPGHDYSAEPQHDSWDNLYLCQYCDTEIIIDPYEALDEEEEE